MSDDLPVFWSFRRCPYAMRARLALKSAQIRVQLREVSLRNKPDEFLSASQTHKVPVLILCEGTVIEESRDIMLWALTSSGDCEGWLAPPLTATDQAIDDFFASVDGPFKTNLDRYKYASRYALDDESIKVIGEENRNKGAVYLADIDRQLHKTGCLSGQQKGLFDYALLPFIRQFRLADPDWFDRQDWPYLHQWLADFLDSERLASIMEKYPLWQAGQDIVVF